MHFSALYSTLCIKEIVTKYPLKYYSLKVEKCHGDSIEKESASTKKNYRGDANPPPLLPAY